MEWIAAELLFSAPLNLTESRWLIQMSRLCLSCQPCPLMGFSLEPLGSRAESPCCAFFKRKHWKDDEQSLGIELCGSSAQQVEDLTLAWLQGEVCHGWNIVPDRETVLSLSKEKGSKSQKQRRIRETFRGGQQNKGGLKKQLWWRQQERSQVFRKALGRQSDKCSYFTKFPRQRSHKEEYVGIKMNR